MKIAEIALNVPLDENFYYQIPEQMDAQVYNRVEVNFGGRELSGFILDIQEKEAIEEKLKGIRLKEIEKMMDEKPIIDERIVEIAKWMSEFYIAPLGETLSAITPSAKRAKKYSHPFVYNGKLAVLNSEQEKAYQEIEGFLGKPETFLIHGVTGSGKTEVYKHLVKKSLSLGKSSIILIPEIALTPQNLERFYESFGDEVAIYHSKLTQSEKLGEWMRALKGEAKVVIGPRSAVFMPLKNLGLIIMDEEHETSYKSNNSPRYHARQIAHHRSRKESAALVLGSATPQMETYYYAQKKVFHLVELKNRFGGSGLPKVEIIDLKEEKESKNLVSLKLLKLMIETLQNQKQVLIFLNRRGFSTVMLCRQCGHTFRCPNCDVSLTFHRNEKKLVCHHCDYHEELPRKCPSCDGIDIIELGSGTEKLESIISSYFPNVPIERMDLDTTRKRNSYWEILNRMKKKEARILIGTQMVAKGHDIAGIHLVGVILPDIILNIPDFRSTERTFVLLTQVIGRAGRRQEQGIALIQTYMPEHYAIQLSAEQNYPEFFRRELEKRRLFSYPPFSRLGRLVIRGQNQEKVIAFADEAKDFIKSNLPDNKKRQILGPVSCPMEKLKNNYRHHIIIKSMEPSEIQKAVRAIRDFSRKSASFRQLYLEIDMDPLSMV
jgi:primosomal protein N' (replication factor Y)